MWDEKIPLELNKYVIVDTPDFLQSHYHSIAIINAADVSVFSSRAL